jgi:hypothetical protein
VPVTIADIDLVVEFSKHTLFVIKTIAGFQDGFDYNAAFCTLSNFTLY